MTAIQAFISIAQIDSSELRSIAHNLASIPSVNDRFWEQIKDEISIASKELLDKVILNGQAIDKCPKLRNYYSIQLGILESAYTNISTLKRLCQDILSCPRLPMFPPLNIPE